VQAVCLPISLLHKTFLGRDQNPPGQSLFILTALAWHLRTFGAIHGA
jgi:hypothetical protein